jgi:hypothetical protein
MKPQDFFHELPGDTPESIIDRAALDAEAGRLSAAGVVDAAKRVLDITGGYDLRDKVSSLKERLKEEEDERKRTAWQLKVALATLADFRTKAGAMSNEVNAALGRITSTIKPASQEEILGYDESCSRVLNQLNQAAEESCLRPGRDDDFRLVAERLDLLDEMPD